MSEIFSKRLRTARENSRKTQQHMASLFGISSVSYGAWERNETEPSIDNIVRLCNILDVSADWLIGSDGSSRSESKPMITARINALKSEADQAAATLARLVGQIKEMEKSV